MAQLLPYDALLNDTPRLAAGTVGSLAMALHQEMMLSGYSVSDDDVIEACLDEVRYYATWDTLEVQRTATAPIELDQSLALDAYEWEIILPVVRAHVAMIHARRSGASESLGTAGYGLSISEAEQLYKDARFEMQRAAFIEAPFSIDPLNL